MRIQNIPSKDWPQFFTEFSREHRGTPFSVEIFGQDVGPQLQDTDLPFEGIVDERKSEQRHQFIIMAGTGPSDHITHTIDIPLAVSVEYSNDRARIVLAIMAADGIIALLRFHKASAPLLPKAIPVFITPHRGRPC